jgi:hypothetical protein
MLYDPALVADAILFACENPRRTLYVGGSGYLISLAGKVAPRLTDFMMEATGIAMQQKPGDAGDPARRDNLYEPRADGHVHGSQDVRVRRTSLFLEAQKQPFSLPFLAAAAGAGALAGLAARFSRPHNPLRQETMAMDTLTQTFIAALRTLEESGDTGPIVALFGEGAEISNPLVKHEAGGPEAAERFWSAYRGTFETVRSEFRNVVEQTGVSMLEWVSEGVTVRGDPFRYGGVSVIEFAGGRISAFRTYFDTAQIVL